MQVVTETSFAVDMLIEGEEEMRYLIVGPIDTTGMSINTLWHAVIDSILKTCIENFPGKGVDIKSIHKCVHDSLN